MTTLLVTLRMKSEFPNAADGHVLEEGQGLVLFLWKGGQCLSVGGLRGL